MVLLRWFIYVLLLIVLVMFTVVNARMVTLSFFPLPYEVDMPFYLVMLIVFLVGVMVSNMIAYGDKAVLRSGVRKKDKAIRKLEKEIESLRKEQSEHILIEKMS